MLIPSQVGPPWKPGQWDAGFYEREKTDGQAVPTESPLSTHSAWNVFMDFKRQFGSRCCNSWFVNSE